MITPAVTHCDFCAARIDEGRGYVKLQLPLPKELRAELVAFYDQEIAPRHKGSPFAAMFGSEQMVPHAWVLEVCIGCIYGLLPDVRAKVSAQVRAEIERNLAAKRRREAFAAEVSGDE